MCSKLDENRSKFDRFWIPEFDQLTIQKSMKFAQQSVKNSCHLWCSLLKMRSKFWFLDLFEFRSLKIALLGAQRTLPGRSRGTPGARRGRSRSSTSTPWAPWNAPGGCRDRFPNDFGCPGDQNWSKLDQVTQISFELSIPRVDRMSIHIVFQIAQISIQILIDV